MQTDAPRFISIPHIFVSRTLIFTQFSQVRCLRCGIVVRDEKCLRSWHILALTIRRKWRDVIGRSRTVPVRHLAFHPVNPLQVLKVTKPWVERHPLMGTALRIAHGGDWIPGSRPKAPPHLPGSPGSHFSSIRSVSSVMSSPSMPRTRRRSPSFTSINTDLRVSERFRILSH